MKGKFLNTNFLRTAFNTDRHRKPAQAASLLESSLLYTLRQNKRKESLLNEQPLYQSVTALIH